MKVRVLRVTGAKDPDEFIKQFGRDAFLRLLDQSENQVDYRLEQIRKKYDLSDDSQKVGFLQEAAQLLSSLPSAVEREIYGGHAAQMAGISAEAMAHGVGSSSTRSAPQRTAISPRACLRATAASPRWTKLPLMAHTRGASYCRRRPFSIRAWPR